MFLLRNGCYKIVPREMQCPLRPHSRSARTIALAVCTVGGLALLLVGCREGARQAESQAKPRDANILLITLDTTRADHLGCYQSGGPPKGAKTPRLDALAARGVRFNDATVQVPLTLPSHACIMTGTYPVVHGLRDMGGFALSAKNPTLATVARQAGFATAAFVGSVVLSKRMGLSRGFDVYDDDMGSRSESSQLPGTFPERRAAVTTDRALDWLRQNGGKRFLLWVHYFDPHSPYDPPQPYNAPYAKDLYSGEIAYMDEQVGRLLDGIAEKGLDSKTLVAVIGDHGEGLGEHAESTHGIFLYDSTLRVPFILAGPEVPGGKVIDDQVRSIDVMPTLLAFLKLPSDKVIQGISLWPLIQQGRKIPSNYAYVETLYPRTRMGWSELRGMRTGTYKLIQAPHPELYDIKRDPKEKTNLIGRYPAEADRLLKHIWEVAGEESRQEKVVASPLDTETRQELESLGYVSAGTPREIRLGTDAPDPKDRLEILKSVEQAEGLLAQGEFQRAAQLMDWGLKRDPSNPLVHIYLAAAYGRMGQLEREIAVYQHALQMKIETDQIYSRLGKAYMRMKRLDKAVEALSRATAMNPLDLDAFNNLGAAYYRLERMDEAERAFRAVIVQNDRNGAAYDGLGLVAVRRGDAPSAQRHFEKALEVDAAQVDPLLNLGMLFQVIGRKELAVQYYTRFLEKASKEEYAAMIPGVRQAIRECSRK